MYARVFTYFQVVLHYHILNVCLSVRFMQDWCLILKLLFCLSLYAGLVLNFSIFSFFSVISALPFHFLFNYFFNFHLLLVVSVFLFSFVCLSFLISYLPFEIVFKFFKFYCSTTLSFVFQLFSIIIFCS